MYDSLSKQAIECEDFNRDFKALEESRLIFLIDFASLPIAFKCVASKHYLAYFKNLWVKFLSGTGILYSEHRYWIKLSNS